MPKKDEKFDVLKRGGRATFGFDLLTRRRDAATCARAKQGESCTREKTALKWVFAANTTDDAVSLHHYGTERTRLNHTADVDCPLPGMPFLTIATSRTVRFTSASLRDAPPCI